MKISATDLANILGITKRTLTHWEKKGEIYIQNREIGRKIF